MASYSDETFTLQGASNFRDFGGRRSADGMIVPGRLFRSNQLSRLSGSDHTRILGVGIATVVDLRSERERLARPSAFQLGAEPDYASPKRDTDFLFEGAFARAPRTTAGWREAFGAFYRDLPELYAEEIGEFLNLVASGKLPILIHCSAGKDRTGVACAILLDILGVSRENIITDYLLSSERLSRDPHFANDRIGSGADVANMLPAGEIRRYEDLPIECRTVLMGTEAAYIRGMFDHLESRYRSTSGYAVEQLGLTREQMMSIKSQLIAQS